MARPHVHPSLHCYRNHRCRCRDCVALMDDYRDRHREAIRRNNAAYSRRTEPLPPDELARLRRLVGLPATGDAGE